MAANTSMLHIRVDDDTKAQASAAFDAMGISMSEAVRIFLRRVARNQAFPLGEPAEFGKNRTLSTR